MVDSDDTGVYVQKGKRMRCVDTCLQCGKPIIWFRTIVNEPRFDGPRRKARFKKCFACAARILEVRYGTRQYKKRSGVRSL